MVSGAQQAAEQVGPLASDLAAEFDTGADITAIILVGVNDAASVGVDLA
jgi:hypothetical protein